MIINLVFFKICLGLIRNYFFLDYKIDFDFDLKLYHIYLKLHYSSSSFKFLQSRADSLLICANESKQAVLKSRNVILIVSKTNQHIPKTLFLFGDYNEYR